MIVIGHLALIAALGTAGYTSAAAVIGVRRRQPGLVQSARNGVYATSALVTIATGALLYLLATDRFEVQYVVDFSRLEQPFVLQAQRALGRNGGIVAAVDLHPLRIQHRRGLG